MQGLSFCLVCCIQENEFDGQTASSLVDSELSESHRFELLRKELIELEKRVQGSADQSDNEEVDLALLINKFVFITKDFLRNLKAGECMRVTEAEDDMCLHTMSCSLVSN